MAKKKKKKSHLILPEIPIKLIYHRCAVAVNLTRVKHVKGKKKGSKHRNPLIKCNQNKKN